MKLRGRFRYGDICPRNVKKEIVLEYYDISLISKFWSYKNYVNVEKVFAISKLFICFRINFDRRDDRISYFKEILFKNRIMLQCRDSFHNALLIFHFIGNDIKIE